ncbi:FAD-dependent oxidoreductase [Xenophilus azovorans]|uniref:oxidoreductase n=1 Tax=Xenophilus azovorans TaxID=151755 RepID=UPI00056FF3FB|nr:FAD-dependent oxidoreductase [Xenophilus azovorans]
MRYTHLLQPLPLKHLLLKNRIVKAPYSSTSADARGYVKDTGPWHYETVARGGVGLFITESVAVEPMGVSGSPRMQIWDDSFIPGQASLAAAVHRHGVPILMQIHHAGPSYSTGMLGHWSVGEPEKLQAKSASTLTPEQLPGPRRNLPRGISKDEIADCVEMFARAAERAAEAGFDGVELHFATGFLVNSFFSRAWNKRDDEYGGSLANRARIGVEIVRAVRQRLGERFIVGARTNAIEYSARHGDGLTHEEAAGIALMLEDAGVDLLNVTAYGYNDFEWVLFPEQGLFPSLPRGMAAFGRAVRRGEPLVAEAEAMKRAVSIPVIAVGKLDVDSAERVLRDGRADLVAFGRALIADPELPNKVRDGKHRDIRPCTHCMTCVDALSRSVHERCRVNTAFAKEKEFETAPPAARRKNVVVVGGGPAGMEAARVAAIRGHAVTLYERSPMLGGLVPLAGLIKGTEIEELPQFVRYLVRQLDQLGVRVIKGREVTPGLIAGLKPDAVVLATGASLRTPVIAGLDHRKVRTAAQLLDQVRWPLRLLGTHGLEHATRAWLPLGRRVVLIGGLMQGAELAEFLVKRGRQVTLTEMADELGTGLLEIHRTRLLQWLAQRGTTLLHGVRYERISDEGVHLVTRDGAARLLPADNVIVIAQREPNATLRAELAGLVPEIHVVGDGNVPGMIVDAVEQGHRAAYAL